MDDKAKVDHGRPVRSHPNAKHSPEQLADAVRGRGHATGRLHEAHQTHDLEAKVQAARRTRAWPVRPAG
jgi:hypothetical protein